MKSFLVSILFLSCVFSFSQEKYLTKSGSITFEASVPSFEEVKAKNSSVSAILNTKTGEFASLALLKGFRFKVALMEEHFNENYVESDTYPKAIFKGNIQNFTIDALTEEKKEYELQGTLTLHGKTQPITTLITLQLVDGSILLKTNFNVKPKDFDIEVPKIVRKKVAEDVVITIDFELKPK